MLDRAGLSEELALSRDPMAEAMVPLRTEETVLPAEHKAWGGGLLRADPGSAG